MKQKVFDAVEEFASKNIISPRVLSYDVFDQQSKAFVSQFRSTIVANNKHTLEFIWFNIYKNNIYTGLRTNYLIRYISPIVSFTNIIYQIRGGICVCSADDYCPMYSGIYNTTDRTQATDGRTFYAANPEAPLLFELPNIGAGCYPYSSLIESTLECFYEQSCIDLLQPYIHGLSLISPLAVSRFPRNTLIETILNDLLIESWNEVTNFIRYYQACSPHSCVYSYHRRFNLLYVIAAILSLFGGLKTVLYTVTPFLIRLARQIQKLKHRRQDIPGRPIVVQTNQNRSKCSFIPIYEIFHFLFFRIHPVDWKYRCVQIVKQMRQKITSYNMFPLASQVKDGLYSTRIYILLLVIGMMILVFYASIATHIRTPTLKQPSRNDYEELYKNYPSTLICPCTDISLEYSSIMNISARFHQVCSSDFIKDDMWLRYQKDTSGIFLTFDFRVSGMTFFYILQSLCKMANETLANELAIFDRTRFINAQVLPYETFQTQTSTIIQQFQQQVT